MEGFIAKKQSFTQLSKTPSPLSIHKSSHSISKPPNNANKPKIRIIHIFAPEIIKTDVENFRELVQRLTGKPTEKDCPKKKITRLPRIPIRDQDGEEETKAFQISKPLAKRFDANKSTTLHGFLGFDSSAFSVRDQRVKEEDQEEGSEEVGIWNINGGDHEGNTISGGGFLDRFSDLEGFIEELNGEFPLLPSLLNPNLDASSQMQYGFGLGGPQLA